MVCRIAAHGLVTTVISVRDSTVLGIVLVLLALVLVVYAVVVARQGRVGEARVLVVVAAVLWAVRIVLTPDELPPGLLGAWPLVVFIGLDGWSERTDGERRLIGIIGLATLGVLATQYDNGGGLNWGARFLAPALPMLAVLLAATLQRVRSSLPHGRTLGLAVVGLAAVTTVASLVGDATLRTSTDDAIDRVAAGADTGVVVTASIALPRLAWRTYPGVDYVVVPHGDGDTIRAALQRTGIDRVDVFQLPDNDFAAISGQPPATTVPAQSSRFPWDTVEPRRRRRAPLRPHSGAYADDVAVSDTERRVPEAPSRRELWRLAAVIALIVMVQLLVLVVGDSRLSSGSDAGGRAAAVAAAVGPWWVRSRPRILGERMGSGRSGTSVGPHAHDRRRLLPAGIDPVRVCCVSPLLDLRSQRSGRALDRWCRACCDRSVDAGAFGRIIGRAVGRPRRCRRIDGVLRHGCVGTRAGGRLRSLRHGVGPHEPDDARRSRGWVGLGTGGCDADRDAHLRRWPSRRCHRGG